MTYAELKAAILKVKAAVETRDPLAAFAAVSEVVKLAGEFFGQPVAVMAGDCTHADCLAACDEVGAEIAKAAAVPQAAGLWLPILIQVIRVVVDGLRK